ncbi:MAG: hypothetical protein JHD16_01455 [Solirubrobacteraceae bacterium]|nr:hypothetical protein [Solirubrobacteraceae bacterium]
MGRHRSGSLALLLVGLALTAVAIVSGYVRSELLDSAAFGNRAVEAVRADPVRDEIATAFADELIARQPRLLAARPALISAADSVLAGRAAGGIISRSASQLHRAVVLDDEPSLVLDLADLSVLVRAYLGATGNELPERLEAATPDLSAELDAPGASRPAISVAKQIATVALISPVLALLCFAGALWLTPDRRATLLRLGSGLMLLTASMAAVFVFARDMVIPSSGGGSGAGAVYAAVFDALLSDVLLWLAVVGGAGALLAASAATMLGPINAPAVPRAVWAFVRREPPTAGWRAARNAGLLVLGVCMVLAPNAALVLAASVVGGYLAVLGLVGLLSLLAGPPPQDAGSGAALRRLPFTVAGIAIAVPFAAAAVVGGTADPGAAAAVLHGDPRACNGSVELCDRRLDEVVFPSSHNANANAAAGYLNANHALSVNSQLDLGIRGMQIDALAGKRNEQGVVRTDLTGETEDTVVEKIGPEALAAAQRLAGRIAFGPIAGDTDLYLCHVLCELGATRAVDEFRVMRSWLDRHPRDVLVLFIQDEASREMIVEGLQEGGLGEIAASLRLGDPLPTLGELIASNKRVVIFAERQAGPVPWYMDGFAFFQETPFSNTSLAQLEADASCQPNRGTPSAPMFQLNHWVESYPPNPVNADTANAPSFILERARRCMREREREPTILAVDFAERGDIVGAARTLNEQLVDQTG